MKRWIVPVTTISLITGVLLSVQWRSQADARKQTPSRRVEDLVVLLKTTEKANAQLAEQVNALQGQLGRSGSPVPVAAGEVAAMEYPALEGPGLVVTVSEHLAARQTEEGTSAVVHAEDLLKIVNELRTGGGEAIALNGHRLTELSEIVTAGQHVVVNKAPVRAPYVIQAIGPAEEMKTTLGLRGGVVEYLQFYGITVETRAKPLIRIPAYSSRGPLRHAQPTSRSLGARPRQQAAPAD